ncbi:MAG: hypothetical protein PHV42_03800 [Candidatus Pacebacteria bacterium]|nr:hypothetical protein [Candidatus Paceibacterota bacterium]
MDSPIPFPSFVLFPLNSIEVAARLGCYTAVYPNLLGTAQLPVGIGQKRVYLVPTKTPLGEHGLKPCGQAPSYLTTLMAQVPEADMPAELQNKNIVAGFPTVLQLPYATGCNQECFLSVLRDRSLGGLNAPEGRRELWPSLVVGNFTGWVMLAEEIEKIQAA